MTSPATRFQMSVRSEEDRAKLLKIASQAALPFTADLRRDRRSLEQNALLWAALEDVARQVLWHGVTLTKEDWKLIFMDGLQQEMRIVPNIEGTGFVNLRGRSSTLTKDEFSQLIELIYAFGAREGVTFRTDQANTKAA